MCARKAPESKPQPPEFFTIVGYEAFDDDGGEMLETLSETIDLWRAGSDSCAIIVYAQPSHAPWDDMSDALMSWWEGNGWSEWMRCMPLKGQEREQ